MKVKPSVKEEVNEFWAKSVPRVVPANSLFINGKRTDLDGATFNLFDVLSDLKTEYSHISALAAMNLSAIVRNKLKSVAVQVAISLNT